MTFLNDQTVKRVSPRLFLESSMRFVGMNGHPGCKRRFTFTTFGSCSHSRSDRRPCDRSPAARIGEECWRKYFVLLYLCLKKQMCFAFKFRLPARPFTRSQKNYHNLQFMCQLPACRHVQKSGKQNDDRKQKKKHFQNITGSDKPTSSIRNS